LSIPVMLAVGADERLKEKMKKKCRLF
jgi:hypothetical protein